MPKTIDIDKLHRLQFCNSDRLPRVILDGEDYKRWVSIGWIEINDTVTPAEKKKAMTVVRPDDEKEKKKTMPEKKIHHQVTIRNMDAFLGKVTEIDVYLGENHHGLFDAVVNSFEDFDINQCDGCGDYFDLQYLKQSETRRTLSPRMLCAKCHREDKAKQKKRETMKKRMSARTKTKKRRSL